MVVALLVISSLAMVACGEDPMDSKLTQENFNAIVVGTTTYEEAKELLGDHDNDTTLTDGDGTIIWKNEKSTKSITLVFSDSVVASKVQTGIL